MNSSRRFLTWSLSGIVALGFLPISGSVLAQDQTEEPADGVEVAKARLYLADFQKAVDGDEAEAQKAYDVLITMSDFVQQGFGRYLDSEWEKRSKAYRMAASRAENQDGPAVTAAIGAADRTRANGHQQELAAIRALPNENEMKKELKAKGWTALQALLRIFKRGEGGGTASGGGSDPTLPAKQVAALKIATFRVKIHEHFGTPLTQTPEEALGLVSKTEEKSDEKAEEVKITASAADRAILRKNEELYPEIGPAEAEGIRQLNEWRISAGLVPLEVDPKLCAAARDHCQDMASGGFFSHTSPVPGKRSFTDRAKNFGTNARAENIAINSSATSANTSWFYSPGHHKNMFGNHTAIGFGASGRHFTQMFR